MTKKKRELLDSKLRDRLRKAIGDAVEPIKADDIVERVASEVERAKRVRKRN